VTTGIFASHQAGWFDILKALKCFIESRRYHLPENGVESDRFYKTYVCYFCDFQNRILVGQPV
jgi:hypothetical protein